MNNNIYVCECINSYFTFISNDQSKEKDATELAWHIFGITADEIFVRDITDNDRDLKPVNIR